MRLGPNPVDVWMERLEQIEHKYTLRLEQLKEINQDLLHLREQVTELRELIGARDRKALTAAARSAPQAPPEDRPRA